jgi:hypothetical protein
MNKSFRTCPLRWMTGLLFSWLACINPGNAHGADAGPNSAALLHSRYEQVKQQLDQNQFRRPLYLESLESSTTLKGDVYARVDYPLAVVSSALREPAQWCDVLILHINIKYCRASTRTSGDGLIVRIGKKEEQLLNQAYRVDFSYRLAAATPEYFEAGLDAEKGPLSTSNYRIVLKAIPISDKQTFVHLTYSYAYGVLGSIALQSYLATVGHNKVGFTVIGKQPDGSPQYIDGVRGVIERNTMRYYLAIDAYLDALATPASQQFEQRLQNWFKATEQYRLQLHEMDGPAYIQMKRSENARQQKTGP